MEIIIGKTAGLCFGVANAARRAEEEAEKNGKVCYLGELAHNNEIKKDLEKKGVVFVDDIKDVGATFGHLQKELIIRTHGVPKELYEEAKEADIELIDLTCPKVLKIHKLVEEYKDKGYYIFLIGEAKHPEIMGTISYAGGAASIIENAEDVEDAIGDLEKLGKLDALAICQTTISMERFDTIINEIKSKLNKKVNLKVINTICPTTKLREEETKRVASEVELMIIIGGKHSSNTKKLYEISSKYCKNSIWIETKAELDLQHIKRFDRIGIMAGASTPQKSIHEVVEMLRNI